MKNIENVHDIQLSEKAGYTQIMDNDNCYFFNLYIKCVSRNNPSLLVQWLLGALRQNPEIQASSLLSPASPLVPRCSASVRPTCSPTYPASKPLHVLFSCPGDASLFFKVMHPLVLLHKCFLCYLVNHLRSYILI